MKLLYNIAGTYRPAGMERVLTNKANWFAAHGYEVVIVTTDQKGRKPYFELDPAIRCIDLGIGYEDNNGASLFNKMINYPIKQRRHFKKLKALLMKERPDITISMFCNDVSLIPRIKDGSRKVLEVHFSRFKRLQYGRKGLWGIVDRWRSGNDVRLADKFDAFVVLTKEDSGYWNTDNIRYIPNARTFENVNPASLDNKKVITVGRYSYQKGYDLLIKVWDKVHKHCPDWALDIVGDGEDREKLQKMIDDLNLAGSVCLKHSTPQITQEYQNASIVALSSRYEGLPMILLEAQTFGLPIVSFKCKCGPIDVITDGVDGYLVDEGDTKGMADRIITLIKDVELRKAMGRVARESSERYSEEMIMRRWVDLFNELCGSQKGQ